MKTIPELPIEFDLALARRLAAVSLQVYAPLPLSSRVLMVDAGDATVLAFRGTQDIRDWITDAEFFKCRMNLPTNRNGILHSNDSPSSAVARLWRDRPRPSPVHPPQWCYGGRAGRGGIVGRWPGMADGNMGSWFHLSPNDSPSPRPSPAGRGRIISSWLETADDWTWFRGSMRELFRRDFSPAARIEVHEGFLREAESLLPGIEESLNRLKAGGASKPLYLTGHSLGGALAVLAAFFLAKLNYPIRAVYTFASPRVGNAAWKMTYNLAGWSGRPSRCRQSADLFRLAPQSASLGQKTFRLAAAGDLVPLLPGLLEGYRHVGQEVFLKDKGGSGMSKININPSHFWEALCDEVRAFKALERLDLDFLLKFHSLERDYLPLLGMTPDPDNNSGREPVPAASPSTIVHHSRGANVLAMAGPPFIFGLWLPLFAPSPDSSNYFLAQDSPTNGQIGLFVVCAAILIGLVATLISIAGYFATRREVDDLKDRVGTLENLMETRTEKLHRRINRLLAGQMLIAGQVGVALEHHRGELDTLIQKIENEEE